MSLFAPLVFTGSALSRSRAEISFPALRWPVSRGKMTFGFSRILTQTLTHTGIRVHGTSGTDRASERGFPSRKGRKPAKMSLHRIQTAAHNPKVVGSSPASATMIGGQIPNGICPFLYRNPLKSHRGSWFVNAVGKCKVSGSGMELTKSECSEDFHECKRN